MLQREPITRHNAVSYSSRRASKTADSREVEGRLVAPPETNDIDKSLDREGDNTRRTAASMNDEAPLSESFRGSVWAGVHGREEERKERKVMMHGEKGSVVAFSGS